MLIALLPAAVGPSALADDARKPPKPISHNLWEGRKMVEAARKYDRIVQYGNHVHGHHTGEMQLETEKLGKIRVVWSSLNRMRKSIGKVAGPQPIPESVDYNLWLGPAPLAPLSRKKLRYDWHWDWSTGTGELGNNGIDPLNEVRLALGQNVLPRYVLSLGERFTFDDDGQIPNSQLVLFQYEPGPLIIFELRNLPSEKGPKTIGSKMKCEGGESRLPKPSGKPGDTGGFSAHKGHLYNFISAVRSRKVSDLRADILEGHLSTAMIHMANTSYRLGTPHSAGEVREAIKDRGREAGETLERFQEHLAANGVDFSKSKMVLGPWLEMDSGREEFVGGSDVTARTNQLLRGGYRKPFVVPEQVWRIRRRINTRLGCTRPCGATQSTERKKRITRQRTMTLVLNFSVLLLCAASTLQAAELGVGPNK